VNRRLLLRVAAAWLIGSVALYTALAMREALQPLHTGIIVAGCGPHSACSVMRAAGATGASPVLPGDRLIAIDGRPAWRDIVNRRPAFFSSREGAAHALTVERDGAVLTVAAIPVRRPLIHIGAETAAVWLAKWTAIGVGALLLWARSASMIGWLAGVMLLSAGLGSEYPIHAAGAGGAARSLGDAAGGAIVITASVVHAAGGLTFPWLWLLFPAPAPFVARHRAAVLTATAVPWAPFAITEVLWTTAAWTGVALPVVAPLHVSTSVATAIVVMGAAGMFVTYRASASVDARRRLRVIFATLLLVAGLWILRAATEGSASPRLQTLTAGGVRLSLVLLPISIGWAVMRHRAFGVRLYVRQAVRHALARGTLLAVTIAPLLVFAYGAGQEGFGRAATRWPLLALSGCGAVMAAARRPLLRRLDRHLFVEGSSAERILLALGAELRQARTLEAIQRCVHHAIDAAYRPRHLDVELFADPETALEAADKAIRRCAAGPTPPRLANLDRPIQVSGHNAAPFAEDDIWMVPIVEGPARLRGYILTGERASGEPYHEEDRLLLTAIARAAAVQATAIELAEAVLLERAAREELAERFHRERDSLTRELHDGVGSTLVRISLVGEGSNSDAGRAAAALARTGMTELRQMLWVTDPAPADLRETAAYLRRLTMETSAAAGIEAKFEFVEDGQSSGSLASLGPAQRLALLRTLQEALTNVITHAGARRVHVVLTHEPAAVRLAVEDDGRGFEMGGAPDSRTGHYGLGSLAQRAAEIGGRVEVSSRPGAGTQVRLEVPLAT
jgi:signal transduction histidine kinase